MKDFIPILLGNDVNSYSCARAFHEAYGIHSVAFGKIDTSPNAHSKIIDFTANRAILEEDNLTKAINGIADAHPDTKILVVACADDYLKAVMAQRNQFSSNVMTNHYIDLDMCLELTHKAAFYELCSQYGFDFPDTLVYTQKMGRTFEIPFDYPLILKPANSVAYYEHPFQQQHKVYIIQDAAHLFSVIDAIYASGYNDSLILQDMIPGDDAAMRVLTTYSDRNKKVKMVALGHTLLEEHTPTGMGNHAVIINDENTELQQKVVSFLESIGYVGFANFDIKYDKRDGKYKFFEINVRQGRSSYYITGAGENIMKLLVDDQLEDKELPLKVVNEPHVYTVIPRRLARRYIHSSETKAIYDTLCREGKVVNPMFYRPDFSLRHLYPLIRRHLSHYVKYAKYYHPEEV